MKKNTLMLISLLAFTLNLAQAERPIGSWELKAKGSAKAWTFAYPVGNGSMGAMAMGRFPTESIFINHDTIWSGPSSANLKPNNRKADLDRAFELCLQRKYVESEAFYKKMKNKGNRVSTFQYLGEAKIQHHKTGSSLPQMSTWRKSPEIQGKDFNPSFVKEVFKTTEWEKVTDLTQESIRPNYHRVYRNSFNVSQKQQKVWKNLKLKLDPIDDLGIIYLNGQKIAQTKSWNSPLEIEIGQHLKPGKNSLAIVALNHSGGGGMAKKVSFSFNSSRVTRKLDLLTGESITKYITNKSVITQKIVANYPDQIIIIRLTTTDPKGFNTSFYYNRSVNVTKHDVTADNITYSGGIGSNGTKFISQLKVIPDSNAKLTAYKERLHLRGSKSATIIIAAATDHNRKTPRIPLVDNWKQELQTTIDKATKNSYKKLYKRAIVDHEKLMRRNSIDLGKTAPEVAKLPLPERMKLYQAGGQDPDLIELFYQMGRHMLIGSSRPGSLPPNLQGLWEAGTRAAWNGDFHLNINVQMNMWLANLTGLNECNEPLFQLMNWLHVNGQDTAKSIGCRGYAAGLASDGWGVSDWLNGNLEFDSTILGGHWVQEHLMEDYRFTGNKKWLKNFAWPILKDGSGFMLDWLRENPKTGLLIAGPAASPENVFFYKDQNGKRTRCYISIGDTFSHQVAWETFTDTLAAAKVLKIQDPILKEISAALKRIPKTKIASDGRVMEWLEEFEEGWKGHRHKSHLYGFHPGHQYSLAKNPRLSEAAKKTLAVRMDRANGDAGGGGQTGWNLAWSANLYARLQEGDDALDMIQRQLRTQVNENLFNRCGGPWQIDGNLGSVAGIVEMLLQSFETDKKGNTIIRLLPALPSQWQNGEVRGLRARGGFIISMKWQNGRVQSATVKSTLGKRATLIYNGTKRLVSLKKGQKLKI